MNYLNYRIDYAVVSAEVIDPAIIEASAKALAAKRKMFRLPEMEIKWFVPLKYAEETSFPVMETMDGPACAKVLHKVIPTNSPAERKRKQQNDYAIYINANMDISHIEKAIELETVRVYLTCKLAHK